MKMKEIRDKRNEYRKNSVTLQNMYMDKSLSYEKSTELKKKQDDNYKRFKFYDNMIKELEKHSNR